MEFFTFEPNRCVLGGGGGGRRRTLYSEVPCSPEIVSVCLYIQLFVFNTQSSTKVISGETYIQAFFVFNTQ